MKKCCSVDTNLKNVLVLGFCFCCIFTSFRTSTAVSKNVLESRSVVTNGTFEGNGYVAQSIQYGVFTVSCWFSPTIISYLGTQACLIIGASTYCLLSATFLYPITALIYTAAGLAGFGASMLWVSHGKFLVNNSAPETSIRNAGISWCLTGTRATIKEQQVP